MWHSSVKKDVTLLQMKIMVCPQCRSNEKICASTRRSALGVQTVYNIRMFASMSLSQTLNCDLASHCTAQMFISVFAVYAIYGNAEQSIKSVVFPAGTFKPRASAPDVSLA